MKTLKIHIIIVFIILEIMMIPKIGFSQKVNKHHTIEPLNIVIEDLNKHLKLNLNQLEKTNQLYLKCTDTLINKNLDFEIELRKILSPEQTAYLDSYLKAGSSRISINKCSKK